MECLSHHNRIFALECMAILGEVAEANAGVVSLWRMEHG